MDDSNIIGHTKALSATFFNGDMPEDKRNLAVSELKRLSKQFGLDITIRSFDKPVYERESRYILFYYRYGGRGFQEYNELREAKNGAEYISDEGSGSVVCIYDTKEGVIVDDLYGLKSDDRRRALLEIKEYLER